MSYELHKKNYKQVRKFVSEMREIDEGMNAPPSSILLSLVATFDSIVGEFVRDLLNNHPEKIKNSSLKTMTYRDIFQIGSLDLTREKLINEEINKLLRGSHLKQVEYLENLIDTKIISRYERWPNFFEIFERRNRYAHAAGIADADYILKVSEQHYQTKNIATGDKLKLDSRYLHRSTDYLTEFGVLLSFMAWRKLGASPNEAYRHLSLQCYELITNKRYKLAIWLLDFCLNKQSTKGVDEAIVRTMHINLANAYKKTSNDKQMNATLSALDRSAVSPEFQICIASLKEDYEAFCALVPVVRASNVIGVRELQEWPVFDWVREHEEVLKVCEENFDVSISNVELEDERERLIEASTQAEEREGEDDSTVH